MLVELVEHALDGRFHDFLGVHLIDIVVDDLVIDINHDLEIIVEFPAPARRIIAGDGQRCGQHRQKYRYQDQAPQQRGVNGRVVVFILMIAHASFLH